MRLFSVLILLVAAAILVACGESSSDLSSETSTATYRPAQTPTPTSQAPILITPSTVSDVCQNTLDELTATDLTSGDLILTETDGYKIIYLISNQDFHVSILQKPFAQNKSEAEGWFGQKGCTATDLCSLRVQFAATKDVQLDFSHGEGAPTGCPLTPIG